MSSDSQDPKTLLLAKQHPETTAKLLRQLSRTQLKLWQEVGRSGLTIADLELRYTDKDMLDEVRILEDKGVVVLMEQAPGGKARSGKDFAAEVDALEEGTSERRVPVERTMEGSPVQRIPTAPGGREKRSTGNAPVREKRASDSASLQRSRERRDSRSLLEQARAKRPTDEVPMQAPLVETAPLSKWADERTTEDRPIPAPIAVQTSPLQQWADERTDEDAPLQVIALETTPLHAIGTGSQGPQAPRQSLTDQAGSGAVQSSPRAQVFQDSPPPQSSAPISYLEAPQPQGTAPASAFEPRETPRRAAPTAPPQAPTAERSSINVSQEEPVPVGTGNFTASERKLMSLQVDLNTREKTRIIEVARAIESGDICGLLGLPNTAERKDLKRAYHRLSKELHPDQYFGRNLQDFQPLLERVFTSLSQYVKALNDKRTSLPNSYRASNQSRRKSQRFHLSLRAQFQCDSWTEPRWGTTQDVSEGGLFLITEFAAQVGEPVRLNLDGPNGVIGMVGKVVSFCEPDQARRQRRNGGLGIQFEGAGHIDYQRLKYMLEQARENTPAFTAALPVKSDAAQRIARGSKVIHRQDHIIGIDLGTTNTAVSAVVDNRVQIVPWPNGSYSMPSIIAFPERGKAIIGYEAQKHLLRDPRNVINSAKRLVGRQLDDPAIASYMAEARFAHHKGPDGSVIAKFWGEDYAIPQICSYLFEGARLAATKTLGQEPTKAVLTVPVSFEHAQIDSMRRAAKLAQLDIVEVIEEPCAAAIANQGQRDFKGIVGVYDFGGGTFDFSLVEAGAGDMRVLATTGDSWLGGDDFDIAIADAAANIFWKSHGTDLRQRAVEWQYLILACEQAKRELSRNEASQVVVPEVLRNAQGTVDLRINLARNKVEQLWAEPIGRSIDTCKQALSLAGVPMSKLSAIFLSGGTSYIPAIRRTLIESFKVPVHLGLAPEHAVCAGAGVRAAILQGTSGPSPVSRKNKR